MCRQVIQIGGNTPPAAAAYIELGSVLYEWNELDNAGKFLQTGIQLAQETGIIPIQGDGYLQLAIQQRAAGENDALQGTLNIIDEMLNSLEVSPIVRAIHRHVQDDDCTSRW